MTDQELRNAVATLALKHGELTESLQETHRRLRESGEETDRRLRESGEETDRRMRESRVENDRRRQEMERYLRELGQQIGGLGEKFGSFTEGLALPSMSRILSKRFGMDVIAPSVRARNNGHSMEVDVLAYSKTRDEVYVVEVKSHLRQDALDQMKKILRDFHDFFPGHAGKKIYGILAAVDAPDGLRKKVLQEGIYLARIHDGQFELQVPDNFQPRAF